MTKYEQFPVLAFAWLSGFVGGFAVFGTLSLGGAALLGAGAAVLFTIARYALASAAERVKPIAGEGG